MEAEVGAVLKINLSRAETLYFKVINVETTALGIRQICTIRAGDLIREYNSSPCSYIYKSELGTQYFLIDEDEKAWLRKKYQSA